MVYLYYRIVDSGFAAEELPGAMPATRVGVVRGAARARAGQLGLLHSDTLVKLRYEGVMWTDDTKKVSELGFAGGREVEVLLSRPARPSSPLLVDPVESGSRNPNIHDRAPEGYPAVKPVTPKSPVKPTVPPGPSPTFPVEDAEKWDYVLGLGVEDFLGRRLQTRVTPSSKTVGDLAQFMVQNKMTRENLVERADELSFTNSVIEYMQVKFSSKKEGQIGQPPYGFPEPLRTKVLRGRPKIDGRPGEKLPPMDFEKLKTELEEKHGKTLCEADVVSAALYPKVFDDFEKFRQTYGPVDRLPTRVFITGLEDAEEVDIEIQRGKTLSVQMLATGDLSPKGMREVFCEVNGQMRSIYVRDTEASKDIREHPKALPGVKGSLGSPMPGEILQIKVMEGEKVLKKKPLAVLSAMKMEMSVDSPVDGTVKKIWAEPKMKVAAGDLLFEIETASGN